MRIVATRNEFRNGPLDKWQWQLFVPDASGREPSYATHKGKAFTRHRAVKKAMKHIPLDVSVSEK